MREQSNDAKRGKAEAAKAECLEVSISALHMHALYKLPSMIHDAHHACAFVQFVYVCSGLRTTHGVLFITPRSTRKDNGVATQSSLQRLQPRLVLNNKRFISG